MLAQRLNQRGISVTHRDVVLYLLGHALDIHPLLVPTGVHVGVMLAGAEDFVAPVIHEVSTKRLSALVHEVAELANSALTSALPAEALEGATFLFADLGAFGLDTATPGVMLPVSGNHTHIPMLSMGRVNAHRDEQTVWLSLGFNPANVKALDATRFLQRVVQLIEDPDLAFT
jgi:pyruvate/2-oxoglutarate dehydrogenase complex dihydrolipoamide acyltransferase (E2) component